MKQLAKHASLLPAEPSMSPSYFIQDSPDAGGKEIRVGYDIEESEPDSKHTKCDEHAFHGRILPILRSKRLPKLRIGGLHQKNGPATGTEPVPCSHPLLGAKLWG